MRTADFDYQLPRELIAQEPAEPRDASRLMVVDRTSGAVNHQHFRDLPSLLREGDLLVVNDTRVMAARLLGRRVDTGGAVEVLLVRPLTDLAWEVMMRPARQARPGTRFEFQANDGPLAATATTRLPRARVSWMAAAVSGGNTMCSAWRACSRGSSTVTGLKVPGPTSSVTRAIATPCPSIAASSPGVKWRPAVGAAALVGRSEYTVW